MTAIVSPLETYIIIPFGIESNNGNKPVSKKELDSALANGGWTRLDGHDLDYISGFCLNPREIQRIKYQAFNYFHPFVRRFWYSKKLVTRYRRNGLSKIAVVIGHEKIVFKAACDLLYFSHGIGVLSLHLQSEAKLELKSAQRVMDELRRIYPPYISAFAKSPEGETEDGGHFVEEIHIEEVSGNQFFIVKDQLDDFIVMAKAREEKQYDATEGGRHIWAKHWQYLLHPIITNTDSTNGFRAIQLGDDRGAIASMLPICHESYKPFMGLISRGDMIRICFADPPGNDAYPYSEKYLESFEKRFCYDRFWYENKESTDAPSRIMNCGYAFTWLGDANDKYYFTDNKCGAPPIFRQIYVPMLIIAHFLKAKLLVISNELAHQSGSKPFDDDGVPSFDTEKLQSIKKDFVSFTQQYWFEEITPQEQGIELFDMTSRELRLKQHYDATRQQMQDIVEYIEAENARRLNDTAHNLTSYGFWIAVFGLLLSAFGVIVGIFGVNGVEFKFENYGLVVPSFSGLLLRLLQKIADYGVGIILVSLSLLFVFLFYLKCKQNEK